MWLTLKKRAERKAFSARMELNEMSVSHDSMKLAEQEVVSKVVDEY